MDEKLKKIIFEKLEKHACNLNFPVLYYIANSVQEGLFCPNAGSVCIINSQV